jgi:pimeloyl-ACP methyl ester carboxylesterase
VLVHGVATDAASFRLLEPLLAQQFTVVSVDRRGRCGSGDSQEYALDDEFADLVRVVDSLPEPATVFGHSFGANVALGAAFLTANVARLVLYEPGRHGDAPEALRDEVERRLAEGDRIGALRLTLLEFTRFPEEWLDDLLETPPWQARLEYAHTIGRELRAYDEHDYGDLSRLSTPALLLVGGDSPQEEILHARNLARALPAAQVEIMNGEGHIAIVTAPAVVARAVSAFAATPG